MDPRELRWSFTTGAIKFQHQTPRNHKDAIEYEIHFACRLMCYCWLSDIHMNVLPLLLFHGLRTHNPYASVSEYNKWTVNTCQLEQALSMCVCVRCSDSLLSTFVCFGAASRARIKCFQSLFTAFICSGNQSESGVFIDSDNINVVQRTQATAATPTTITAIADVL